MWSGFDQAITQVRSRRRRWGERGPRRALLKHVFIPPLVPCHFFQVGPNRVWRISDANNTAGFGDQPWCPPAPQWAGETGAGSYGPTSNVTATTNNICFVFEFTSSTGAPQGQHLHMGKQEHRGAVCGGRDSRGYATCC